MGSITVRKIMNHGGPLAFFAGRGSEAKVSLAIGEPKFDSLSQLKQAMAERSLGGPFGYLRVVGSPELRSWFADRFRSQGFLEATPETTICGTGATSLLAAAFNALVNRGDRVLVVSPYYPKFLDAVELAGGIPIIISRANFFESLVATTGLADTMRVKGVVINSPNNPTGEVWSGGELVQLADIAGKRNLWVLSDETYGAFIYPDTAAAKRPIPIGTLIPERTVTIRSFSKELAVPGLRFGYATGPIEVIQAMAILASGQAGCPNLLTHEGVWASRQEHAGFTAGLLETLGSNRELVRGWCRENNIPVPALEGAFYAWMDIGQQLGNEGSEAFAGRLLKNHGVAVIPGTAFGVQPEEDRFIRVAYALPKDDLIQGLDLLAAGLRG